MQRGLAGSGAQPELHASLGLVGSGAQPELHASPGICLLPNPNLPFQPGIGGASIRSTLPLESSAISPHGVNMGAPPEEHIKRRRGRPRKYDLDGSVSLALTQSTHPETSRQSEKRGRGRPRGSGKKHQSASLGEVVSGSAGTCFTPHVITVATGEDIASKIMAFSQQGPRAVCILSANGIVSNVTLRLPSVGGTAKHEGHYEILCLSGSYVLTESGGSRNQTGALSVSLASSEGRVIGGRVGSLIAASPVQLIVGSFLLKKKEGTEKEANVARESDDQAVHSPVVSPNQNLTQASSSMSSWRDARQLDMRNAHFDIDLTRG
ncbi:AT-hook motif nuclear-localized protein 9-like [Senna tora]|uniref:AT-hook motif nuclear-localized protein n=1 Tax=Senna tora TaxID=362788 RepID=A0A834XG00_9FABA|nr:AT-hook motif nuclear-localized protein 9-like [Senna tora]